MSEEKHITIVGADDPPEGQLEIVKQVCMQLSQRGWFFHFPYNFECSKTVTTILSNTRSLCQTYCYSDQARFETSFYPGHCSCYQLLNRFQEIFGGRNQDGLAFILQQGILLQSDAFLFFTESCLAAALSLAIVNANRNQPDPSKIKRVVLLGDGFPLETKMRYYGAERFWRKDVTNTGLWPGDEVDNACYSRKRDEYTSNIISFLTADLAS